MRRNILATLCALLCLTLLAGCSWFSSNSSTSSSNDLANAPGGTNQTPGFITSTAGADQSSSSLPQSSSGGSSGSQASSQSVSSQADNTVHSVTGTIYDAAMSHFYVELEDGLVIPFDYSNADLSGLEDSRPGNPITVYFTGTLQGADSSGVTVTKMETP